MSIAALFFFFIIVPSITAQSSTDTTTIVITSTSISPTPTPTIIPTTPTPTASSQNPTSSTNSPPLLNTTFITSPTTTSTMTTTTNTTSPVATSATSTTLPLTTNATQTPAATTTSTTMPLITNGTNFTTIITTILTSPSTVNLSTTSRPVASSPALTTPSTTSTTTTPTPTTTPPTITNDPETVAKVNLTFDQQTSQPIVIQPDTIFVSLGIKVTSGTLNVSLSDRNTTSPGDQVFTVRAGETENKVVNISGISRPPGLQIWYIIITGVQEGVNNVGEIGAALGSRIVYGEEEDDNTKWYYIGGGALLILLLILTIAIIIYCKCKRNSGPSLPAGDLKYNANQSPMHMPTISATYPSQRESVAEKSYRYLSGKSDSGDSFYNKKQSRIIDSQATTAPATSAHWDHLEEANKADRNRASLALENSIDIDNVHWSADAAAVVTPDRGSYAVIGDVEDYNEKAVYSIPTPPAQRVKSVENVDDAVSADVFMYRL